MASDPKRGLWSQPKLLCFDIRLAVFSLTSAIGPPWKSRPPTVAAAFGGIASAPFATSCGGMTRRRHPGL